MPEVLSASSRIVITFFFLFGSIHCSTSNTNIATSSRTERGFVVGVYRRFLARSRYTIRHDCDKITRIKCSTSENELCLCCTFSAFPVLEGYRLGETPEESKVVVQNAPAHAQRQEREVAIHFFRDGFSVDDGPLRDGQSDEDKKFLKDISQG